MQKIKHEAAILAIGVILAGLQGAAQQLPPEPGVEAELRSSSKSKP